MFRWIAAFLMVLWTTASPVHADELRPGYLEFTQKDESNWSLIWKAPIKGGLTPQTQPILPAGCTDRYKPRRNLSAGAVLSVHAISCADSVAGKTIGLSNMDIAQTDILVRVAPLNKPVQTMRLTASQPTAQIAAKASSVNVAKTYFVIGVEHILFGFDHLLFVIALLLLIGGGWRVVKAVTAFTLAHSITLVGSILGYMGLPQRPVEAIIALSILFLAVEIIKRDPEKPRLSERLPWIVAFVFGLLHGFGFAGALSEIGLPEGDVPMALLTFNLGVEAGQLLIVAACLGILWLLRRYAIAFMRPAITVATYAIGITASFWLFDRLL
ncbi:HupE/UreJ family protein [Sphingorhabdus arenilitoris]|uniref:HupE/UreJ family protein n=1 Tax=Sphingorhabdus arenilitoris TaxID=1490041 RepID=A0ABV8RGB2_9SPHN